MSDSDSDSTDSEAEDANLLVFQRVSKPHNESVLDLEKQAIRRDRSVAVATASRDATQSLQQQTQPVVEIDDTDGLDPEQEFRDWQARERGRYERELKEIEERELEIQERMQKRAKRKKST